MPTGTLSITATIAGKTITSGPMTRTGDSPAAPEFAVPLAKAGQLTTRTDNDTGTITMAAGDHGITTGAVVDIYWSGGARYGVLVGTVSGTSVPIGADNSGTGSNLPTNLTNVTVSVQTAFNCLIDGDALALMVVKLESASPLATGAGYVAFKDASNAIILALSLSAGKVLPYDIAGGASNPFTGNPITKGVYSQADTVNLATLILGILQDGTP